MGAVVGLAIGAALWACGTETPSAPGGGGNGNTAPVVKDGYVQLTRGIHPLAKPEFDRGALDTSKHLANLSLAFKLTPAQIADREALKAAQLDPGSPSYHQWLTPAQYAARFGAKPADIQRARDWLASQGLEVHDTSPLGARVTFSGSVGNVQSAFRAEMRNYEVNGKMHYAMSAPAQVPVELKDVVLDVTNTHDFVPKSFLHRLPGAAPVPAPEFTTGSETGFAPPDWANVYDVAQVYTTGVNGKVLTGNGVTIGIVGVAQIAQGDIDAWRTKFSLPASTVTTDLVPNTGVSQGDNGGGGEATLDVEWSGALGQGAKVVYTYVGADDGNVDDATYYLIENNATNHVDVMSESFGSCDAFYLESGYVPAAGQSLPDIFGSAANLLGITYLASAGDAGATTCLDFGVPGLYTGPPADQPEVTAVGGTQFKKNSFTTNANGYFSAYSTNETTWNERDNGISNPPALGAGGGGLSQLFLRPSYQSGLTTCPILGTLPVAGAVPGNLRMVPDVSFASAGETTQIPLFLECTAAADGDCSGVAGTESFIPAAGTSFASPTFAGVVSLLVQQAGGRLGNINPFLYQLATASPAAFHDIQTGNNDVSCASPTDPGCPAGKFYGYPAGAGYDCATGLGSLDVYKMLLAASALAPTTTTLTALPTTTTEGTAISLTAAVAVPVPNAQALQSTGVVTYNFQSYNSDGTPDESFTFGTADITGGTVAAGSALLSKAVPVGIVDPGKQYVDVVAEFGGDEYHLPSVSAKVRVNFGPVKFCIAPATESIQPSGTVQFAASGGVGAVTWSVPYDSTCDANGANCSTINASTGAFKAGIEAGYAIVLGQDSAGAYQLSELTVGNVAAADAGPAPWNATTQPGACPAEVDAGSGGGVDASTPVDAGVDSGGGTGGGDAATGEDAGEDAGGGGEDAGTDEDSSLPPPVDASVPVDSGTPVTPKDAGHDSAVANKDAATEDGGGSGSTSSSSGCSCKVVNGGMGGGTSTGGGLAGLALGLGLVLRRRRRA